jgi:hypothetical protein
MLRVYCVLYHMRPVCAVHGPRRRRTVCQWPRFRMCQETPNSRRFAFCSQKRIKLQRTQVSPWRGSARRYQPAACCTPCGISPADDLCASCVEACAQPLRTPALRERARPRDVEEGHSRTHLRRRGRSPCRKPAHEVATPKMPRSNRNF